jgi:hypothetical protein
MAHPLYIHYVRNEGEMDVAYTNKAMRELSGETLRDYDCKPDRKNVVSLSGERKNEGDPQS